MEPSQIVGIALLLFAFITIYSALCWLIGINEKIACKLFLYMNGFVAFWILVAWLVSEGIGA